MQFIKPRNNGGEIQSDNACQIVFLFLKLSLRFMIEARKRKNDRRHALVKDVECVTLDPKKVMSYPLPAS